MVVESKGSSGLIARDSIGYPLMCTAKLVNSNEPIKVEAEALVEGIKRMSQFSEQVEIEPDFKTLVDAICGQAMIPWKIKEEVRTCQELMTARNVKIMFAFRSANMTAHSIARHVLENPVDNGFVFSLCNIPYSIIHTICNDLSTHQ